MTKTEIFLLGLTAAFLLSAVVLTFCRSAGKDGEFTVTPQFRSSEEQTEPAALSLNSATQEQLEELDGIGPVLAQRIIDYREAHGGFADVEELLEIDGIGPGILDDIRDAVTIEEEP